MMAIVSERPWPSFTTRKESCWLRFQFKWNFASLLSQFKLL